MPPTDANVLPMLQSLLAGGDTLAVHNDHRFLEATLLQLGDDRFVFRSVEGLTGPCVFSTPEYQFAVDTVTRLDPDEPIYHALLPASVTHVQKRSFLRRHARHDGELHLEFSIAHCDYNVAINNLSLSGMEIRLPAGLTLTPGTRLPAACLRVDDGIVMDLEVVQTQAMLATAGLRLTAIGVRHFQALQRLLSDREVWSESDFTIHL